MTELWILYINWLNGNNSNLYINDNLTVTLFQLRLKALTEHSETP